MRDENCWEVDRIAAAELLAMLEAAPEANRGELAARFFAKSRMQNYEWAAQRVRDSALKVLENQATELFHHKEPAWTDGFRHAEKCIMAKSSSELLEVNTRPSRSRGQVLRSLLRSARRRGALPAA